MHIGFLAAFLSDIKGYNLYSARLQMVPVRLNMFSWYCTFKKFHYAYNKCSKENFKLSFSQFQHVLRT